MRRAALGATPPCKAASVDGVRIAYDDEGHGAPIVCLHAIGHGARDFEALRADLRDRQHVIALDWPGQGCSDADTQPPSAERYAALLEGFLDALGIERALLLGNSIGGAAALRLAAAAPARVRALVLANPGGLDRNDALTRIATRGMAAFFDAGSRGARWYPGVFAAYYRMVLPAPAAAAQRARIVAAAREMAPLLAAAWRGFGRPQADLRGLASQVRCPVLFAWARGDRINQLRRCRAAIARFPNARLETFEGGHAAFLEQPRAFGEALERFLAAV